MVTSVSGMVASLLVRIMRFFPRGVTSVDDVLLRRVAAAAVPVPVTCIRSAGCRADGSQQVVVEILVCQGDRWV